ncbi:MAG: hypothetical protein WCP20_08380 [Desulfuromonadales bacterium]
MPAIEIIPPLLSFFLGMCVLYLTAYSKIKRKNRALQDDITRLEDEKQQALAWQIAGKEKNEPAGRQQRGFVPEELKIRWEAPTDNKRRRPVNIEKRECSLDKKRRRFANYFTLLDEFHRKTNDIFTLQFHPIMNRFLASNSLKDETDRNRAILEFNREVQNLFNRLYEEQHKVNLETDSIRSFSSSALDETLDKLESAVRQSTDDAAEVLKFMATPELWAGQSLTSTIQKAEDSVQILLTCRNAVRSRMKMELDSPPLKNG